MLDQAITTAKEKLMHTITRGVIAGAAVVGAAIGLAGPASADPASGNYTGTMVDGPIAIPDPTGGASAMGGTPSMTGGAAGMGGVPSMSGTTSVSGGAPMAGTAGQVVVPPARKFDQLLLQGRHPGPILREPYLPILKACL